MKLRTSHLLLSLATAVPLVVFAAVAAVLTFQQENANFVNAALARNRATLAAVDAELQGAIGGLRALSVTDSIKSGDFEAFHRDARIALTAQPDWQNVVLQRPDGEQLVDARLPWGAALLKAPTESASLKAAVATRKPAIGDLAFAPLHDGQPNVAVRLPIVRAGQVEYVLSAMLDPAVFERLLIEQKTPDGWATGIVGKDGRLIARVPRKPPGAKASPDYLQQVAAAEEGWYRGLTIEGADTFTAFSRSRLTGWTIGYAVPSGLIVGGALRAAGLMGLGIGLTALIVLALTYWLQVRFARPLSLLADAAKGLGTGRGVPATRSSIDELRALEASLAEADATLARRNAELREQTLRLEEANSNKSRFLALLSHELRNPLAPLRNGLSLLGMNVAEERRAALQPMMMRQVDQLVRLIDDLLDVSRIDRGQLELRRENVDVAGFVGVAVETCQPAIEEQGHDLVVEAVPPGLFVNGDRMRLAQAVANLLGNAAKYTPRGGRIVLAVREEDARAVIEVTDNGPGFEPEDAERIFDMFVRLDASRAQAGGLGIGLTLVRSLAQLHGGTASARSAGAGQGAVFRLELPLAESPARRPEPPDSPALPAAGRTIVVADDNRDALETMGILLRMEGHEVHEACDGPQALEAVLRHAPDVAFIDLDMPRMGGLEVARRLRSEGVKATLVALTGLGQPGDLEATRQAGFDAHLTKPASVDELLRVAAGDARHTARPGALA